MATWLRLYGQLVLNILVAYFADPTGEPAAPSSRRGLPTWAIILIIGVVLVCVAPFVVIVILALLGPVIGDVLSDIVMDIKLARIPAARR